MEKVDSAKLIPIAELLLTTPAALMGWDDGENKEMETPVTPRTPEARILSAGVDRMPEAARKKAVQLMEMVFAEYADYFKDEGDESDES